MGIPILMIAPQFRPIIGGYERAAERLAAALMARGHSITIVTERRDRDWAATEIVAGVEVRRLWCVYKPHLHAASALLALGGFLIFHGRRYHVWHIHQWGVHAVLAIVLAKVLRRPTVLKPVGTGSDGAGENAIPWPLHPIGPAVLRTVDALAAVSERIRNDAVSHGIARSRVHLLGNGIDTQLFRSRAEHEKARIKASLGITSFGVVLFVGRLSRDKNPDGLLRAWQFTIPHIPSGWDLIIIGDGPMRAAMSDLITLQGLGNRTLLLGVQSNVDEWMAAADLLVVTSHSEGLSNTMLEAMSSGLPVVSTAVSGASEVLEAPGAGVVVQVGHMESIAQALVDLILDQHRRERMGEIGRTVIEQRFAINNVAEAYEQLYVRLVHTGGVDRLKDEVQLNRVDGDE